jgi:predicted dehydrogenase
MPFDGEVLVIGLGSIGERHVRNLLAMGHRNISVLRRNARLPRTLLGDEFTTITDPDEAFARNPAIVIIGTPTALHMEPLTRAVEIGAAVLVEVPLAHRTDGLELLMQRAQETGAQVLLGHNLRFHPALVAIRQALQRGDIGEALYSRMQFGEYLPTCHAWADFKTRYEARNDLGGGVVLTSIHELDHAFWLFGPIASVTAVARSRAFGLDVEDVAMMVLEHAGGMLSEIELDFVQRTYRRSLQVAGREGTIEWELLGDRVRIYRPARKEWEDLVVLCNYDINQTYLDELRHLIRVAERRELPLTDLATGLHVLRAGLAALKSSATGRRVHVATHLQPEPPLPSHEPRRSMRHGVA